MGFGEPSYIENLTPAERRVYLGYYVEDQKERAKQERGNTYDALSPDAPPSSMNMKGMNVPGINTSNGRPTK